MVEKKHSNHNNWETPTWLYKKLDKQFSFDYDPCPLNESPDFNGLKEEWGKSTFVNPPYSHPLPFVRKAIEESRKGKLIVMLLKMDTSTNWFKELKEADAEFLWINGRLHYNGLHHTYKGNVPLSFPSMFVILKPKELI